MTEIEKLDDLIGRGVVSFATIGFSTLGDGKQRHACVSIKGTMRFTQGYGDTAADALGRAVAAINDAERPAPDASSPAEEHDPLADILG